MTFRCGLLPRRRLRSRRPQVPQLSRRRITVVVLLTGLVTVVAVADRLAAAMAVLGVVALRWLLRRRSRGRARTAMAGLVLGVTLLGVLAAVSVPAYRASSVPLLVPVSSQQGTVRLPAATVKASRFELTGFVVADDDGAARAVDSNVASISTLAATGVYLAADARSLMSSDISEALARAHLGGARGELTVSNYDATRNDFNPDTVDRMLTDPQARTAVASQLTAQVVGQGWDGLVLDFEQLRPRDRSGYVALAALLRRDLPDRRLVVAVPAYDDPADPDRRAYDLRALASLTDTVVLMAYDQHDPTSAPGPVAGLPWVRVVLRLALREVPRSRLVLGVPSYAYAWRPRGPGVDDLSVGDARTMVRGPGWHQVFDRTQGEQHAWSDRGDQVWWDDARSVSQRIALARAAGLRGAAVWRLGGGDRLTPEQTGNVERASVHLGGTRPVVQQNAIGFIALTFDDGPDPTWTPRVLDVLRREGVPATFFDVGVMAQAHPELVRREVAEGHLVGNHTFSHLDSATLPAWRARWEVMADQWALTGITGRTPMLFRSPYGGNDIARDPPLRGAVGGLAARLGLRDVDWTVDPEDWSRPGVRHIVDVAVAQPAERTIVLLHDAGGDRSQTLAALPEIIHRLKRQGYAFTTVDALDPGVSTAYAIRSSPGAIARGLLLIATYRLWQAARTVALWLVVGLGALGLSRLLICLPLALHHRRTARRGRPLIPPARLPTVTVLIPAHNEERVLGLALQALARSSLRPQQVLVLENGSSDGTAGVARRHGVQVRQLGPVGKAGALAVGLAEAEGEVVVVLDADTVLDPYFLQRVLPHFVDPAVGAVAANIKVGNHRGLLTRLQELEYVVALNLDRRAQAATGTITVVPGAAGAFRRSAVVAAGGWPTDTLVEDADLTLALLRAKWRIPYADDAIAYTEAPQSAADVLRQRRRWAYGTVQVAAKHADALFTKNTGRTGWLALPWLLLTQVVLPAAGPAVELFAGYLCLVGAWPVAASMLGIAVTADLIVALITLRMDGSPLRLAVLVPLSRVLWRPLLLTAVVLSTRRWVRGEHVAWRRVARHGTVALTAT